MSLQFLDSGVASGDDFWGTEKRKTVYYPPMFPETYMVEGIGEIHWASIGRVDLLHDSMYGYWVAPNIHQYILPGYEELI